VKLTHYHCHSKRLSAIGLNVLRNRVETILTPRFQNDHCAQACKVASGTLSETAARTRDNDNFSFNVPAHACLLVRSHLLVQSLGHSLDAPCLRGNPKQSLNAGVSGLGPSRNTRAKYPFSFLVL
jgi:hypothetical protein